MKTDLFQSCGHCWVFQICWHIECSTFTASSFRIWNISTGIPSPPLALFVVMLPKAHLTSHSRMSGSRSVITPSWLSGSWRSFLYNLSVYSCHLFLISFASLRSLPFLSFIEPVFSFLPSSSFTHVIFTALHPVRGSVRCSQFITTDPRGMCSVAPLLCAPQRCQPPSNPSVDCGPSTLRHGVFLLRGPVLLLPLPLGPP